MIPLRSLELPWKLLITLFLLVLSAGFAVAEYYLYHTTEEADGIEGMGLDDITFTFYGGKDASTLKLKALGSMKKYFSETENEKALTADEQKDLDAVLAWVKMGAPEEQYWIKKPDDEEEDDGPIRKILRDHSCLDCHTRGATMSGNKKDSPLDTYKGISKFTGPGKGMDKGRLLMLSHVHLLGMGVMFLLSGAAVAATRWPRWLRSTLVVGGLLSVPIDIFGWWGVKYGGPAFSPVVLVGGILMSVVFVASVLAALCDVWLRPLPAPHVPAGSGVAATNKTD